MISSSAKGKIHSWENSVFLIKRKDYIMIKRVIMAVTLVVSTIATAQIEAELFGDQNQPGNRLHTQIVEVMETGADASQAISEVIEAAVTKEARILNGEGKSAVAFNLDLSQNFYSEMISSNSLIDVVKVLSEEYSEKAVEIISLGAALYPDYVQDIYDGAVLAGVMASEDILVALLQAGADPSAVSDATAAAGNQAAGLVNTPPLGTGVGAGGTGGGDTTASTN